MSIPDAWKWDGVTIPNLTRTEILNHTKIEGIAFYKQSMYTWEAVDTSNGWEISVYSVTMRRSLYTAVTRNLALEIATAVKRHL